RGGRRGRPGPPRRRAGEGGARAGPGARPAARGATRGAGPPPPPPPPPPRLDAHAPRRYVLAPEPHVDALVEGPDGDPVARALNDLLRVHGVGPARDGGTGHDAHGLPAAHRAAEARARARAPDDVERPRAAAGSA